MSRPAPRSDDDATRNFLRRIVQDNPGIHVSSVNPGIDSRPTGHLLDDLISSGEIAESADSRLHPQNRPGRRKGA
jgi:hypothetical protein